MGTMDPDQAGQPGGSVSLDGGDSYVEERSSDLRVYSTLLLVLRVYSTLLSVLRVYSHIAFFFESLQHTTSGSEILQLHYFGI